MGIDFQPLLKLLYVFILAVVILYLAVFFISLKRKPSARMVSGAQVRKKWLYWGLYLLIAYGLLILVYHRAFSAFRP